MLFNKGLIFIFLTLLWIILSVLLIAYYLFGIKIDFYGYEIMIVIGLFIVAIVHYYLRKKMNVKGREKGKFLKSSYKKFIKISFLHNYITIVNI